MRGGKSGGTAALGLKLISAGFHVVQLGCLARISLQKMLDLLQLRGV